MDNNDDVHQELLEPVRSVARRLPQVFGGRKFSKGAKIAIWSFLFVALLIGVILFGVAWDTIEPVEYGFNYNSITGDIDMTKLFEGGRYFLGVGHHFVKFPRMQVTMEFSNRDGADSGPVATRTANGVSITLGFSFQYVLQPANLGNLYNQYGQYYSQPMLRAARAQVLAVAGDKNSTDYWLNRQSVQESFQTAISMEFQLNYFCNITMFQLLSISLPESYEESIIQTQVQQQTVKQQQYQQQVTIIQMQISQLWAQANKNITEISAAANASAITVMNQANIASFNYTQTVQAKAFQNLATTLNMTPTQLLQYIKVRTVKNKMNGRLVIGLDKPTGATST